MSSIETTLHNVKSITLSKRFLSNGNSRTIRITCDDPFGQPFEYEIILYGQTEAVEGLPHSDDFYAVGKMAKSGAQS